MRRRLAANLAAIVVAITASGAVVAPTAFGSGPEGIAGTVRHAGGVLAPGAEVWLISTYPTQIGPVTVDAAGNYELDAPAGSYDEAVAYRREQVAAADGHAVDHEVQRFGVTLNSGATTVMDWILPSVTFSGACSTGACALHFRATGFAPGAEVRLAIGSIGIIANGQTFEQTVGRVAAAQDGTASADVSIPTPMPGRYFGVAVSDDTLVSSLEVRTASSRGILTIGATSTTRTWAATFLRPTPGRATLPLPAVGWATARYTLTRLRAGTVVRARIVAGASCGGTVPTIIRLPGFTATTGGTWTQRWRFDASALTRLRRAAAAGTTLRLALVVGSQSACIRLVPVR